MLIRLSGWWLMTVVNRWCWLRRILLYICGGTSDKVEGVPSKPCLCGVVVSIPERFCATGLQPGLRSPPVGISMKQPPMLKIFWKLQKKLAWLRGRSTAGLQICMETAMDPANRVYSQETNRPICTYRRNSVCLRAHVMPYPCAQHMVLPLNLASPKPAISLFEMIIIEWR